MSLLDGIIGCWSPSVTGAGYTLPDLVGGNHGTLLNMDASDWTGVSLRGVSGKVLDFDGVDDVVACTAPSRRLLMETGTTPWTVSMWVNKRGVPSSYGSLVGSWKATSVNGWVINIRTDGTLGFGTLSVGGSGGMYARTSATLANGWQHLMVVYYGFRDAARGNVSGQVFINGAQVAVSQVAGGIIGALTSPQFSIGGSYDASLSNDVQIGEVAVFYGNKTSVDSRQIYTAGNGALSRALSQSRRRVYSITGPAFRAAWATRATTIAGVLR